MKTQNMIIDLAILEHKTKFVNTYDVITKSAIVSTTVTIYTTNNYILYNWQDQFI